MKPVLIDLFAGRLGWSAPFLADGWRVIAFDLVMPDMTIPDGVEYILQDILSLSVGDLRTYGAIFATCSSPCEEFSVHGMKHFHPNPKYPEMGIKLFNHARSLLEGLDIPYVMENVRPARNFIGTETNHCGPFYLWGPGVPSLMPYDAYRETKGMVRGNSKIAKMLTGVELNEYRKANSGHGRNGYSSSKDRKDESARVATIPESIARAIADVAARYIP